MPINSTSGEYRVLLLTNEGKRRFVKEQIFNKQSKGNFRCQSNSERRSLSNRDLYNSYRKLFDPEFSSHCDLPTLVIKDLNLTKQARAKLRVNEQASDLHRKLSQISQDPNCSTDKLGFVTRTHKDQRFIDRGSITNFVSLNGAVPTQYLGDKITDRDLPMLKFQSDPQDYVIPAVRNKGYRQISTLLKHFDRAIRLKSAAESKDQKLEQQQSTEPKQNGVVENFRKTEIPTTALELAETLMSEELTRNEKFELIKQAIENGVNPLEKLTKGHGDFFRGEALPVMIVHNSYPDDELQHTNNLTTQQAQELLLMLERKGVDLKNYQTNFGNLLFYCTDPNLRAWLIKHIEVNENALNSEVRTLAGHRFYCEGIKSMDPSRN